MGCAPLESSEKWVPVHEEMHLELLLRCMSPWIAFTAHQWLQCVVCSGLQKHTSSHRCALSHLQIVGEAIQKHEPAVWSDDTGNISMSRVL